MDTTIAITEQEVAALSLGSAAIGAAAAVTLIIIGIIAYIVSALGFCKMFKKADTAGWKAYVPFVNTYEKFKLSWNVKNFWYWLAASAVSFLLYYFAEMLAGGTAVDFLPDLLASIAGIVALGYTMQMNRLLAQSYGYGKVCGVCLWLFPFITSLVVGFGKARYIGNQSAK